MPFLFAGQRSTLQRLAVAVDIVRCATENVALSVCDNAQARTCWEDLTDVHKALQSRAGSDRDATHWSLCQLSAILQRLRIVMSAQTAREMLYLQPTCRALGEALSVDATAAETLAEDTLRGGPAAPLAQLLVGAEGKLAKLLGRSAWRVIAPGREAIGGVVHAFPSLVIAQTEVFTEPAILIVDQVRLPARRAEPIRSCQSGNCSLASHFNISFGSMYSINICLSSRLLFILDYRMLYTLSFHNIMYSII